MLVKDLSYSSEISTQETINESMAAYVEELRKLSEFCNYGDKLDNMLKDRIVHGINHSAELDRLSLEGIIEMLCITNSNDHENRQNNSWLLRL